MELTRLLPIEKWNQIESDLYEQHKLQGSVFNTDGIRITNSKNWANQLCPAIKSTDKGQSFICAVAHMNMSNQARKTKKPVIEECDAGLLKLVVPIYLDDKYLGVIGGCGLLAADDGEVDIFAINKITDMDDKKIEELSAKIPTLSLEKANSICARIEEQLEEILSNYKNGSL